MIRLCITITLLLQVIFGFGQTDATKRVSNKWAIETWLHYRKTQIALALTDINFARFYESQPLNFSKRVPYRIGHNRRSFT